MGSQEPEVISGLLSGKCVFPLFSLSRRGMKVDNRAIWGSGFLFGFHMQPKDKGYLAT